MICNNTYLADILRVCEIKDLIWVMRFLSPSVYKEKYAGIFYGIVTVQELQNYKYKLNWYTLRAN